MCNCKFLIHSLLIAIFGSTVIVGAAFAAELTPNPDRAILTITGSISATNSTIDGISVAILDRAQIEALPQVTINTTTEWTDGVRAFSGPLARDVLALVGSGGTMLNAVAANDYAIDIPASDFDKYDVILALEMDGVRLRLRDKGPIWIVYPRDQHVELFDPVFNSRWIWQLVKIDVR